MDPTTDASAGTATEEVQETGTTGLGMTTDPHVEDMATSMVEEDMVEVDIRTVVVTEVATEEEVMVEEVMAVDMAATMAVATRTTETAQEVRDRNKSFS